MCGPRIKATLIWIYPICHNIKISDREKHLIIKMSVICNRSEIGVNILKLLPSGLKMAHQITSLKHKALAK